MILERIWRNSDKFSSYSLRNSMKNVRLSEMFSAFLKISKTFRRKFATLLNVERCEGMIILILEDLEE